MFTRKAEGKSLADELNRSLADHGSLLDSARNDKKNLLWEHFNATQASLTEVSLMCKAVSADLSSDPDSISSTLLRNLEVLENCDFIKGHSLTEQKARATFKKILEKMRSMQTYYSKIVAQMTSQKAAPRLEPSLTSFYDRINPWLNDVLKALDPKFFNGYDGDISRLPHHIASLDLREASHLKNGLYQLLDNAINAKTSQIALNTSITEQKTLNQDLAKLKEALSLSQSDKSQLQEDRKRDKEDHLAELHILKSDHESQLTELNKQIAELQASLTSAQTSLREEQAHSESLSQELESARAAEAASRDIINRAKVEISKQLGLSAEMPLNDLTRTLIHRGRIADLMEGVNWRRTLPTLADSLAALQADLSSYPFLSDKVKHLAAEQIHEMERRISSGLKYLEQLESGAFGQNQALEIRDATICRQPIWVEPDKASHKSSTESIALSYVNSVLDVAGADVYSHLLTTLGLEQVSPNQGEPYDAVLHQTSGKEPWPRPGSAEIGSVAAVRRPGIKKGGRLYVKADVYLYGETILQEYWKEALRPAELRERPGNDLHLNVEQLSLMDDAEQLATELKSELPYGIGTLPKDAEPNESSEELPPKESESDPSADAKAIKDADPHAELTNKSHSHGDQGADSTVSNGDSVEQSFAPKHLPLSTDAEERGNQPAIKTQKESSPLHDGDLGETHDKDEESKSKEATQTTPRKRRQF